MDQNTIKKEDVAAPSIAGATNAPAPTALPVATPAPAAAAATTPGTVDANKRSAPVGNGSLTTAAPAAKKANTATTTTTPSQKTQLQQQIQQQLQQQLQAQLQAAAARGQQANITPEQIQVRKSVHRLQAAVRRCCFSLSGMHASVLERAAVFWTRV